MKPFNKFILFATSIQLLISVGYYHLNGVYPTHYMILDGLCVAMAVLFWKRD